MKVKQCLPLHSYCYSVVLFLYNTLPPLFQLAKIKIGRADDTVLSPKGTVWTLGVLFFLILGRYDFGTFNGLQYQLGKITILNRVSYFCKMELETSYTTADCLFVLWMRKSMKSILNFIFWICTVTFWIFFLKRKSMKVPH